jgi:putative hemolysin
MTDEEIESFIDMWRKSWTLEKEEHEKIKNILEFWDILVEEIMVPRVKIECLSIQSTVWNALEFYLSHTHSRIPLYNKTIDKIDSFLTIRNILEEDKSKKLKDLDLSPVLRVPLNQPIDILLKTFQTSRKHLAIVIDEYGWVAGLVTLEDVLEEIFWEIRDETDKEVDEISQISKDNYEVESDILIEDILEKFNLNLGDIWLDEREFGWETLSYIITHVLERFPKQWEIINFKIKNNQTKCWLIELKIIDIDFWKIGKVEVKKIKK